MFKLTVVAGPNRGTSYPVKDGENSIGRQSGNAVVLQSAKVSKRHCVLIVDNGKIEVQDQGSSNGTFVNGVLTKAPKQLKTGDKISVGEYVLELVAPITVPRAAPAVSGLGNVVQFPTPPRSGMPPMPPAGGMPGALPGSASIGLDESTAPAAPADLKGKLLHAFETRLMPVFYGMVMKTEWRVVALSIFAIFVVTNVFVSVYPLLEANRTSVIQEVARRARFMARQIADTNAGPLSVKAESKTDIGIAENAENVHLAVLTDLDNRIIAPATKSGGHLASGPEARLAVKAAEGYRVGRENGVVTEMDESMIVAVEPVKVFSPALGRNIVVGMAIVSIDSSQSTLAAGEMGTIYSKTFVLSALLAAIALLIVYRMTMKPFQVLNDDMDKALKGEMAQVTHEFKFEELNSLWDLINSSLQRVSKTDSSGQGGGPEGPAPADYVGPLGAIASAGKLGLVLLDAERKIAFVNPLFEEISGIRADSAVGQEISTVARDQAMGAMTNDLFDRAQAGTEGVSDNFDFSGISHKVYVTALGKPGESPRCYVLATVKNE